MDIEKYVDENYTQDKKTMLIERVACYIRVSTQEQKLHGLSLDAQRDTLKRFAKVHGLKIVEWYEDEGVSGRKLIRRRPALQRMLHDAQEGKFDRIIFIKLDRYFRSVAEYYECQKILETNKVTWTATEERYDLTTASGRYWVTQKLAMAEYEADNTGERIKLVNEYKIRTGQPLTGAQSQGYAYTVTIDEDTKLKKVIPDPETKEICEDYINHYLTHQNKRQAYIYVRDKYNLEVSYNTLAKILIDSKIWGHYKGNDFYCEPYVDKVTFDKIQDILSNNIKTNKTKNVYLYSGLISCPQCGRKLTGSCSKSRTVKKPSGKVYVNDKKIYYYKCNNNHKEDMCTFNKNQNEKKLESTLISYLDQFMTQYIEVSKIEDNTVSNSHAADQIKQIKSEMSKLNTMYRKSRITDEEYDRDYEDLEARLKAAESHLEPIKERDLDLYKDLLKSDWKSLYCLLDREHKRSFWRKYIKAIVLDANGQFKDVIFF